MSVMRGIHKNELCSLEVMTNRQAVLWGRQKSDDVQ
jgi:hypothetical protein